METVKPTDLRLIDTVFFGKDANCLQSQKTILHNPWFSEDHTTALQGLTCVVIDAETCDFRLIERFITYAINNIGSIYLKKNINVCIYGDLSSKHPNTGLVSL